MITYHEMEDDVLYSREIDQMLARLSRAAGEKIELSMYCPKYETPADVPLAKRSAIHMALYREALDALEEAHRGDGGRPITFSSFKELLGKAAEEAARQRAGREQP